VEEEEEEEDEVEKEVEAKLWQFQYKDLSYIFPIIIIVDESSSEC